MSLSGMGLSPIHGIRCELLQLQTITAGLVVGITTIIASYKFLQSCNYIKRRWLIVN